MATCVHVEEALPCRRLELQLVAGVGSRSDGASRLDHRAGELQRCLSLRLQILETLLADGRGRQCRQLHGRLRVGSVHLLRRPEVMTCWRFEDARPLKALVVVVAMAVVVSVVVVLRQRAMKAVEGRQEEAGACKLHAPPSLQAGRASVGSLSLGHSCGMEACREQQRQSKEQSAKHLTGLVINSGSFTEDSNNLERGCRLAYTGCPSFFDFNILGLHVPTFWLLLLQDNQLWPEKRGNGSVWPCCSPRVPAERTSVARSAALGGDSGSFCLPSRKSQSLKKRTGVWVWCRVGWAWHTLGLRDLRQTATWCLSALKFGFLGSF